MESNSVKILNKNNTFIDDTVTFGVNVIIYEGNRIEGKTHIGDNTILLPNNYIKDSFIGNNVNIHASVIEDSIINDDAVIGPFARIRPGTTVHKNVKIGNFVEVKNSSIGGKTKISHLAYVGDSEIGENTNIGCGVIFANYNGRNKNKIYVGSNCFVGSNTNLIAPLKIEDDVYICAGTTVTETCKKGSFIIGRARAETKDNRSYKYLRSE